MFQSCEMPKKFPVCSGDSLHLVRGLKSKLEGFGSEKNTCSPFKYQAPKNFKGNKNVKLTENFDGFITPEKLRSAILNSQISRAVCSNNRPNARSLRCLSFKRNIDRNILNKRNIDRNILNKRKSNTMAVDFDHMYLDCGDSKLSIGRDIELQHLKELNILHLDLIQQQAEQLIAKDKIIKSLKEENKNLRARLERIDRRVSLSLQKKASELSPISVQTDFDVSYPYCIKSELSPKSINHKSPAGRSPILKNSCEKSPSLKLGKEESFDPEVKFTKKDSPRKLSPKSLQPILHSPVSPQPLRASPREKRVKRDVAQTNNLVETLIAPAEDTQNQSQPQAVGLEDAIKKTRTPAKRLITEEIIISPKKTKNLEPEEKENINSSLPQDEGLTDHNLRSRDKTKDSHEECTQYYDIKLNESSSSLNLTKSDALSELPLPQPQSFFNLSSDANRWKPSFKATVETRKVRGDGILTTDKSYYLPSYSDYDYDCNETLEGSEDLTPVEIPKWRTKILTSLYVMEGTENLEDEIFLKRHAKPEQDERRRKRWDLQRMREQRQYEKLLERYEGRNNPNDSSCRNQLSLWPAPESAQSLHIDNDLPVCAFGQPLAHISENDFFVPWLAGKLPLQVDLPRRRSKR